jgi:hypothetical protein
MTTQAKNDQILPTIWKCRVVMFKKTKQIFSQIQADSRRRRAASSGSLNTLAVCFDKRLTSSFGTFGKFKGSTFF